MQRLMELGKSMYAKAHGAWEKYAKAHGAWEKYACKGS